MATVFFPIPHSCFLQYTEYSCFVTDRPAKNRELRRYRTEQATRNYEFSDFSQTMIRSAVYQSVFVIFVQGHAAEEPGQSIYLFQAIITASVAVAHSPSLHPDDRQYTHGTNMQELSLYDTSYNRTGDGVANFNCYGEFHGEINEDRN